MKNQLSAKLNNKKGASFIIALIYFLVAGVVAALIITAAVSNASKMEKRADNEEAYQAASHVAEVLCSELDGMEYVRTTIGSSTTEKMINPAGTKKHLIGNCVSVMARGLCTSPDQDPAVKSAATFTKPAGDTAETVVEVSVKMDRSFNLSCLVHATCGNGSCDITVFTGASVLDENEKMVSHDDNPTSTEGDTTEYNDTTQTKIIKTISWQGSKIAKGDKLNSTN